MSMSRKKEKVAAQKKETTRQLIDIQKITEYGLLTSHGELVFFSIEPTNLSVHSPESIGSRIYALMTVLKGQTEIEMLALNSKESFEDNKRYYRERAAMEELPVISRLLEADARSLDRLQVQMATAREFFVLIRFRDDQDNSHGFRKAWKTKASRCALLVKRTPSACWGCTSSKMPPPKSMKILMGSVGSC